MFSAQMQSGVDPWVAAWSSEDVQSRVSRSAAARFAVMEAVRKRRSASRSARRSPWPARVGLADHGAVSDDARSDELTPVG